MQVKDALSEFRPTTPCLGVWQSAAGTARKALGRRFRLGTLTNFPIALNSRVRLPGSPAPDAFLLARLQAGIV
jgi:hypothetical protein